MNRRLLALPFALVALGALSDAAAQVAANPWGTLPSGTTSVLYPGTSACGAQVCTQTPTAALCTNPCWAKTCGGTITVQGACKPFVEAAFRQSAAQAPEVRQLVAPPSFPRAGERLSTRRKLRDASRYRTTGYAGTLAGDQASGRNAAVPRTTTTTTEAQEAATAATARQQLRARWEQNGNVTQSCEEYVFEKFHSYGRFLDAVAGAAGDPRQVFTLAYAPPHSLPSKPLVKTRAGVDAVEGGGTVRFALPAGPYPKNDFVARLPGDTRTLSYPSATATFIAGLPATCKPHLFAEEDFGPVGRLAAVRGKTRPSSYSGTNAAALGLQVQGWDDEDLDLRYQKQLDFRRLMTRRHAVMTAGSLDARGPFDPSQRVGGAADLGTELTMRLTNQYCGLAAVDREIQVAFREARDLGCFGLEAGPCDFSPRWFMDTLLSEDNLATVEKARNAALAECRDFTNMALGSVYPDADLADLVAGKNSSGPTANRDQVANWTDYRKDTPSFDTFRAHARTYLAQAAEDRRQARIEAQVPDPERPGKKALGRSFADSGSVGGDGFGGAYQARAGWSLIGYSQSQLCTAKLRNWAELDARGTVLWTEFPAVYFQATTGLKQVTPTGGTPTATFDSALTARILGVTVYSGTYDKTFPTTFSLVADPGQTFASSKLRTSFVAAGVPVNVGGYAAGGAGVGFGLSGRATSRCVTDTSVQLEMFLAGELRPYAELDGVAEVSVGIPGVLEAGVRGRLTLVRGALPLGVKVDASYQPDYAAIRLHAEQTLGISLDTLSGRLSLYLSSLGADVWEGDLVKWDGVTYESRLMGLDYTLGLRNAATALE